MTTPASPRPSTYDVFLAFCPAATLLSSKLPAIGLDAAARVVAVDLYYRAETDVVLVGLRLDARVGSEAFLTRLRLEAAQAGASVLEPARLEAGDRARFYAEHLAQYKFKIEGFPTVADAARKLAADLGSPDRRVEAGASPRVKVRFRTGDRWQLARARNLTREGFYVYSGAPPRSGEVVTVTLEASGATATLQAMVVHVTPDDAAVTVGGPGFGGRFMINAPEERSALERIVLAGRIEGLGALRAAPARREARYAVRWPVSVGPAPVVALDLSQHGLFVTAPDGPQPERVALTIAADDGGKAIQARARVARSVSSAAAGAATGAAAGAAAGAAGLTPGVGLELVAFTSGDQARYQALVVRVAKRATRRLLVGATTARLAAVVDPLVAAGYVVTGVSTPADLDGQAARVRPDLLVLDAGFSAYPPRGTPTCLVEPRQDSLLVKLVDRSLS